MKAHIISDTHGFHYNLRVPTDIDMIIHCGDCSNNKNPHINYGEVVNFMEWFDALPVKYKIYVPGNHDTSIETGIVNLNDYKTITFLIHESTTIENITIFGSPYTPRYGDWAFMKNRNRMELVWRSMPKADIVVTHGPPKGYLDLTIDTDNNKNLVHVGCQSLANRILELSPRYHCFGHIHSEKGSNNFGIYQGAERTTFVNAACLSHTNTFYNGHLIEI